MYYYIAEVTKELIDIKREATKEEYDNLEPHLNAVSKMLVDKNRIEPIMLAYKKLCESIFNLTTKKDMFESRNIQYNFSQYLFEFKKFLDNWETELSRKYGKESIEFKTFKMAQSNEYDEHMEYRIMYQLRNYDQHCGNIISQVTAYIDENENKSYKILMNRDLLLKSFDKWKQPEIEYLKSQPEYIDIRKYILQLQKSIVKIYEKTIQIHFDKEFLMSCAKIIDFANEFDKEDDVRIIKNEEEINEEFWSKPTKTMNFVYLMVPVCKEILAIYFRNNIKTIKVIFHGNKYRNKLNKFAIEADSAVTEKISKSNFINLAGQNMIRLVYNVELDTGNMYAVLADTRFKHSEIAELCTNCSFFLKTLCKN